MWYALKISVKSFKLCLDQVHAIFSDELHPNYALF